MNTNFSPAHGFRRPARDFLPLSTGMVESLILHHRFLTGMDRPYLPFFTESGRLRKFEAGEEVFHEGNPADHFYLVCGGTVTLETFVPGRGRVEIQTLGEGEALGWSWLFPPHQWMFTAIAIEEADLLEFDAVKLRNHSEANRDFGNDLVKRVARVLMDRLHGTRMQLVDLYGARA